jgi:Protein of unknown function (DUF2975)
MAIKATPMLKFLYIIAWIVFIGLCVNTGSVLFSYIISMFFSPKAASNMLLGLDLSELRNQDKVHYSIVSIGIMIVLALKAWIFFVVIQIYRKINDTSPFNESVGKLFKRMGILSFICGLLSIELLMHAKGYATKGFTFPHLTDHIGDGTAFLFFAGILYFISLLYAKGIELQKENELTV